MQKFNAQKHKENCKVVTYHIVKKSTWDLKQVCTAKIDYQTAKVQSTLVFNPKICIKQWKNASSLFSFRINFFCLAYSDPIKLHLKPKIDLFLTFILQLKTHIDFSLSLMLVHCLWFYLSTQCYMHMSQVDYSNTLQYILWREDKISHCCYLNIYISRKIRLCVVDLEGQFQTTLQAKIFGKDNNFLI